MGGGRFGIIQAKMMIAWTRAVAVGLEKHGCVYSVFLGCRIGRTRPRRERSQQRQLSDLTYSGGCGVMVPHTKMGRPGEEAGLRKEKGR